MFGCRLSVLKKNKIYAMNAGLKIRSPYKRLFLNCLSAFNWYDKQLTCLMKKIIAVHGEEEWRAVMLTHELHGHIGVYSIIGAKMGIHALELFGTTRKKLEVHSYAGFNPPLSCMNDGLQASIGATIGNNLLKIEHKSSLQAGAVFSDGKSTVYIGLSGRFQTLLSADLANAPGKPESENLAYWEFIERLSMRYWLEWDRGKIFEITTDRILSTTKGERSLASKALKH